MQPELQKCALTLNQLKCEEAMKNFKFLLNKCVENKRQNRSAQIHCITQQAAKNDQKKKDVLPANNKCRWSEKLKTFF